MYLQKITTFKRQPNFFDMYSLIYRSVAKNSFDKPGIYKMLSEARDFNAIHSITGCLLYHQGQFIQLLEGAEAEVASLFERIRHDPIHRLVELLEDEEIEERIFDQWSMAFQDMGDKHQQSRYKLMLMHSYFHESKIFTQASKTGLVLFKRVQELLRNAG